LTAFSRAASTFEPFEKLEDVGFKSSLLNDIVFAIPKIKGPLKAIVDTINLQKAKEGNLTELWRDEEKYPALDDCKLVSYISSLWPGVSPNELMQAIASVESEMEQHLKEGLCSKVIQDSSLIRFEVRKQIRRPGLNWITVSGIDVGSALLEYLPYIESLQYLVEVPNADNKNVPANWTRVSGLATSNVAKVF
jgi:DNA mismatch repair protein MSH3